MLNLWVLNLACRDIPPVKNTASITLKGEGGCKAAGITATLQNLDKDSRRIVFLRALVFCNLLTEFVSARILRFLAVPECDDGVGNTLYITCLSDIRR